MTTPPRTTDSPKAVRPALPEVVDPTGRPTKMFTLRGSFTKDEDFIWYVVQVHGWTYNPPATEGDLHRLFCSIRSLEAPTLAGLASVFPLRCSFSIQGPSRPEGGLSPGGPSKVTVITKEGDVVMVCDRLESFFSKGGRSFAYCPEGVHTYLEGRYQGTHSSLHEAFGSLGEWSYAQYVLGEMPAAPSGPFQPSSKVIVIFAPGRGVVGCFRKVADLFSSVYFMSYGKYESAHQSRGRLVMAPLRGRSGYEIEWTTSDLVFAELEKKGWRKTTPRVVEYRSSIVLSREVGSDGSPPAPSRAKNKLHPVDAQVEEMTRGLAKKAAILKSLNVKLSPEDIATLLS